MVEAYKTELHKFIEDYLKTQGAYVDKKTDTFFEAVFPSGKRVAYTYSAKVAASDKEIKLLAKGSQALKDIIDSCNSKTTVSTVNMNYTCETVGKSLTPKACCNLCQFISICENPSVCCSFCHYFRKCNTIIENAHIESLGEVTNSNQLKVMCFIFTLEITNDYSHNRRTEKDIAILFDMDKKEFVSSLRTQDILDLDINNANITFSEQEYYENLTNARRQAEKVLNRQLEVFRKEIEGPIYEKITSIVNKYSQEYADSYTSSTLEELDEMQKEALELCKREIRGYTINTDIHLKNIILLNTTLDERTLLLKNESTGTIFPVEAEIFLSLTNILCDICGNEIDHGYLCNEGHVVCRQCSSQCHICGKIICDACDDDNYICSTCGEIFCSECIQMCSSCGSYVCNSHAYRCTECNSLLCIDCYEICSICDTDLCKQHAHECSSCHNIVCSEHIAACSICKSEFCSEHTEECAVCGNVFCLDHIFYSKHSGNSVCEEHLAVCNVCNEKFTIDEIKTCALCEETLCPDHSHICAICGEIYCHEHVQHCPICSNDYCKCDTFEPCKVCGSRYCSACINTNGICSLCNNLSPVNENDIDKSMYLEVPALSLYKKFFRNCSNEITLIYAKKTSGAFIAIFDDIGKNIYTRQLNFLQKIKLDAMLWRSK